MCKHANAKNDGLDYLCTDPSFQATTQLGSVAHNNQQQVSAWGKSRQVKKETEIKAACDATFSKAKDGVFYFIQTRFFCQI